jgi:hypothetical protein
MGSLEPLIFSAQAFMRHDASFRPMNYPAYSFLKQNEGNPKDKHGAYKSGKYEQHSEKFPHRVEIHFKLHPAGLFMTV